MPTTTPVHVAGLEQLGARMRGLSAAVNNKIGAQATGAAAGVVKKAVKAKIKSNPTYDTGSMYEAVIAKKIPRSQTKLTSEHIVTFRGKAGKASKSKTRQAIAPHAHFAEFGTVNMPAEPTLRPGFETSKGQAVEAMIGKLKAGITKAGA